MYVYNNNNNNNTLKAEIRARTNKLNDDRHHIPKKSVGVNRHKIKRSKKKLTKENRDYLNSIGLIPAK